VVQNTLSCFLNRSYRRLKNLLRVHHFYRTALYACKRSMCQVYRCMDPPLTYYSRPRLNSSPYIIRPLSCPVVSCLSVCNVGVLRPNAWTDQDETWHTARPRPQPHCIRWGPSSPQASTAPIFGPCPLWPNDWMDLKCPFYGGKPRPVQLCVRWGPSSPQKRGTASP